MGAPAAWRVSWGIRCFDAMIFDAVPKTVVLGLRRPVACRLSLHFALSPRCVPQSRVPTHAPRGFSNLDRRSGWADSNPLWSDTFPLQHVEDQV
jgi:hypothetical protein